VRIEVDRPDPENREFTHADPIGWTQEHRGEILHALYTILLGNPVLRSARTPQTRFKTWWRLVGSAVEHAAKLASAPCTKPDIKLTKPFKELFLTQEADDEDSASLGEALTVMSRRWIEFKSTDIADLINTRDADAKPKDLKDGALLRDFLLGHVPANFMVSAKSVGRLLRAHLDNPVVTAENILTLRCRKTKGLLIYFVAKAADDAEPEAESAEPAPACAQCGAPGGNEMSIGKGMIRLHPQCERAYLEAPHCEQCGQPGGKQVGANIWVHESCEEAWITTA
jgi:hypothetical protein